MTPPTWLDAAGRPRHTRACWTCGRENWGSIRERSAGPPTLRPLPARRYDTAYWERRQVGCDAYVEVRGNRYSVPAELAGHLVTIRLSLEGQLGVYDGEQLVAQHVPQPAPRGGFRALPRRPRPPLPLPNGAALWFQRRPRGGQGVTGSRATGPRNVPSASYAPARAQLAPLARHAGVGYACHQRRWGTLCYQDGVSHAYVATK